MGTEFNNKPNDFNKSQQNPDQKPIQKDGETANKSNPMADKSPQQPQKK